MPKFGYGDSFMANIVDMMRMPDLEQSSDILKVRRANRQPLMRLLPGAEYFTPVLDTIYEHINF